MSSTYSAKFGINRGISPDITLLHMFLGHFFASPYSQDDITHLVDNCVNALNYNPLVNCKEQDPQIKQVVLKKMEQWIRQYSFASNQRGLQPIPYHKNLIYDVKRDRTLRLLYMLYPDNNALSEHYEEDCRQLFDYLYEGKSGVYSSIVEILYNIISTNSNKEKQTRFIMREKHSIPLSESSSTDNVKWINNSFRRDFTSHMTAKVFQGYDSFRRIDSLMLMVNFYLTMYAICRATDETIIFAKGAEDVSTPEGSLHATAIGCFSNIRERVFSDSEGFYLEEIAEILDVRGTKLIKMIEVDGKDEKGNTVPTIKMDGAKEWKDLRDNLMSSRRPEVLDRIIIEYLDLNREEEKDVNLRDLAKAFVDYSKKRASSVRKISSVFSVQGQQAKFVFPKGGSHKYYGMSGELVQLLLKLCLAEREKDSDYLTLEAFLLWLENKYGIFIASSDKLTGFLKSNSIRIPSFSEFELNTQAFIHTLEGISAVQKMSDKTYIVHDSGKVGVFDW